MELSASALLAAPNAAQLAAKQLVALVNNICSFFIKFCTKLDSVVYL